MRTLSRQLLAGAVTLTALVALPLRGQALTRVDSLFARARQLVSDGNGAAGRALVDSILGASTEGAALHGEALYWRAVLSESGSGAQHDYLRVTIEYPTSERAPDALLRLAQLELARGEREPALRHLERLTRDYPDSPLMARAHLWNARALLEGASPSTAAACASVAQARSRVAATDVELRNQIDFYGRRCSGVDSPVAARPAPQPVPARGDTAPAQRAGRFSVQVAAYENRSEADALRSRLMRRGMDARVASAGAKHRVWVGRHVTRAEANAALQELKRLRIEGFVVEKP